MAIALPTLPAPNTTIFFKINGFRIKSKFIENLLKIREFDIIKNAQYF
jgi:hypothetical protein